MPSVPMEAAGCPGEAGAAPWCTDQVSRLASARLTRQAPTLMPARVSRFWSPSASISAAVSIGSSTGAMIRWGEITPIIAYRSIR